MEFKGTLLYQLKDDLSEYFKSVEQYKNITVKTAYDGNTDITYPLIVIAEIDNSDNYMYTDNVGEHVVDVGYDINILAGQSETLDGEENVRTIQEYIKQYMQGERYHALHRSGPNEIDSLKNDSNIKIGYMRYTGCIATDTNTIYRRI